MITQSPYKIGYGHKGRIAGTEPETPVKPVKTYDSEEDIQRCLNCDNLYCAGFCKKLRAPGYKPKGGRKVDHSHLDMAKALDAKEAERARKVSQMVLDGWCESAIARELGLTVDEVNKAIKLARKRGLLY